MKSPDEVAVHIAEMILHRLLRPLMYAGSPEFADTELQLLVELWLFVTDADDKIQARLEVVWRREDAKTYSFSEEVRLENLDATEEKVGDLVANRWYDVCRKIDLPLPFDLYVRELPRFFTEDRNRENCNEARAEVLRRS